MQIVVAIIYMLVGILLAIPYCLLAGWDTENFPTVALVTPAFLFIWFMAATFAGIINIDDDRKIYFNWRASFGKSDHRVLSGSLSIFWAWTLYSFLPVILHWSAVLLGKIGYETTSSLIDTHRYASSFYVLIATFILLILTVMVISAWDAVKNVWIRIVYL